MNPRKLQNTLGLALASLAILSVANATAGELHYAFTPYAWATDLKIQADMDGRQIVDEKIPVGDLVKQIDMIFQGRFDVQYRTLALSADVFDVTMSDDVSGVALPQGAGTAAFTPEMRMTIFDLAAGYSPRMRRRSVTALAGMRLVYERADVDATFLLDGGPTVNESYEGHETLVDALVGVRYVQPLTPHWLVQTQLDASTGGTRYTWSASPTVAYVFDAARRYTLGLGYRHMQIDFEESDGIDSKMSLSGPVLSFRIVR